MVIPNWALKVFMRKAFLLLSSKIDSHLVANDISPCHQSPMVACRNNHFHHQSWGNEAPTEIPRKGGMRRNSELYITHSCSDTLSHTRSSYHCYVVGICYSVVLARVRCCCLVSRTDSLALHSCRGCKQNIRQEIPHHHGKTTER